jgi:hypothetical protein
VPGGIWYYTVTPAIALWTGAESPRSTGISSDSVAPVATVQSVSPTPNAAGWNNTSPVTLTITADDGAAGSGVASITYTLDDGAQQTVNGGSATVTVSGDGTHTLSYFATDNAGNAGSAQTRTVRIDTAAPAAPGLTVPAYVNSANVAAVPVTGTSEAGAKITLTVRDTGTSTPHSVSVTATASGTGTWSASLDLSSFKQGTVNYNATATDAAGNTSTLTAATNTKDTAAPAAAQALSVPAYVNIANASAVPVSGTAEATGTVTVTASDAGGAHTVTGTATASGTGAWSLNLNLNALNQGTVTYTVTVRDAAGNTGAAVTPSPTSMKDTNAPSLDIDPLSYIYSGNVDTYSIGGSTDSGTTVSLNVKDTAGSAPVTAQAPPSGSSWKASGLNLSGLQDSNPTSIPSVTVTAITTDAAGNSTTTIAAVIKDIKLPTVTGVKLTNGGSTQANKSSADSGDTVTLSFSESMNLTKFCSNWTGSQLAGSATISDTGNDDTLSVSFSGCTIGTVTLGGNYLIGPNASFGAIGTSSSLTWDPANNALVIKFGNGPNGSSGAGTLSPVGVAPGKPGYKPSPSLTDAVGNPIGTVSYTDTATSSLG